ncbi:MAG TPA: hypothetical protein PKY22_00355 [Accumulibacter sp.]|nr:hypothetical protein [Accumulibacter sp.]
MTTQWLLPVSARNDIPSPLHFTLHSMPCSKNRVGWASTAVNVSLKHGIGSDAHRLVTSSQGLLAVKRRPSIVTNFSAKERSLRPTFYIAMQHIIK